MPTVYPAPAKILHPFRRRRHTSESEPIRDFDWELYAEKKAREPLTIPELIEGLTSATPTMKFGCAKALRYISEKDCGLLLPFRGELNRLLDSDNQILRWNGLRIMGNIATHARPNVAAEILADLIAVMRGKSLIAAANAIEALPAIAHAHPTTAPRIVDDLVRIEKASFATPECTNIAIGHAILALAQIPAARSQKGVTAFVERQLHNRRRSTRQKALGYLDSKCD